LACLVRHWQKPDLPFSRVTFVINDGPAVPPRPGSWLSDVGIGRHHNLGFCAALIRRDAIDAAVAFASRVVSHPSSVRRPDGGVIVAIKGQPRQGSPLDIIKPDIRSDRIKAACSNRSGYSLSIGRDRNLPPRMRGFGQRLSGSLAISP